MEKRVTFRGLLLPLILVLPQLAVTAVFFFYPAGQAVWQSLFIPDPFGLKSQFVGLGNFEFLLEDPYYRASFVTTAVFSSLVTLVSMGVALWLAVLADRLIKGSGTYRTLLIWPYAVAPAVAGVLWLFMFNTRVGLVSWYLGLLGYDWNHVLNGEEAMALVVIASSWGRIVGTPDRGQARRGHAERRHRQGAPPQSAARRARAGARARTAAAPDRLPDHADAGGQELDVPLADRRAGPFRALYLRQDRPAGTPALRRAPDGRVSDEKANRGLNPPRPRYRASIARQARPASWISRSSSPTWPTSCTPTGRPLGPEKAGRVMQGPCIIVHTRLNEDFWIPVRSSVGSPGALAVRIASNRRKIPVIASRHAAAVSQAAA